MVKKDIYLKEVLDQTPRLLGCVNRNYSSRTYGCFDRQYWHYNTTDFPCAEFQESVLTLAYLYQINHEINPYYQSSSILESINAGISFWCKIQHKNGSFAEWYPNENSMSVTPFSTYAISETLLLLKEKVVNAEGVVECLEKAGNWLMENEDMRATNHYAGSTVALYNLYILTKNLVYRDAARRIILTLRELQNEEGWFMEYNGADVGYTSVTIYYLANYYKKVKDEEILSVVSKALDFLYYFMHPDGTFGGEYGSRNTEYLIPHGFEIIAQDLPKAALVAREIRKSMVTGKHVTLRSFDDRYLCYLSYMYIQAYADACEDLHSLEEFPYAKEFVKYFKNAGLRVVSTPKYYCVQSIKKGGAFKLDGKKQNSISFFDSGVVVEDWHGKACYSFYFNENSEMFINSFRLKITRQLARVPFNILTPGRNIFQRLFLLTIGKREWIEKKIKDILRNLLITNIKLSDFNYIREIEIVEEGCTVVDRIDKVANIKRLIVGLQASYVYGPSTRYFQPSSLNAEPLIITGKELSKYTTYKYIKVIRQFDTNGKLISFDVKGE